MRYFVTILTLYINSSRAYVYMSTRARSTCTEERLELREVGKGEIEETEEEKEKRKRAHRDLLLMKNKYTTHADESLSSFLPDQFLPTPSRFRDPPSPLLPLSILSHACISVHMYMYVRTYIHIHTYSRSTVHRNIRLSLFAYSVSPLH